MIKILRKIPLIIWAVILFLAAFFIVNENYFQNFSSEQIRLLSSFLTFIGLIFVAINIQRQWRNERIKTEYLNQPNFVLKGVDTPSIIGYSPKLCGNPTECTDDHWFDILQDGNLAAKELKIALFTEKEAHKDIKIKERWLEEERLGKGDKTQYKLPMFKIPFTYFQPNNKMCFIVLMEYKSEYSNVKYKRVYELCTTAVKNPQNTLENDWKGRIYFYDSCLIDTLDSESITIREIVKSNWYKLATKLRLKKDFTYNDWLIEI